VDRAATDFVLHFAGETRAQVLASTGQDIDLLTWNEFPPTEFCSDDAGIVVRHFVGGTYVEWRMAREAEDPSILIEDEGEYEELVPALLASVPPEGVQPLLDSIPPAILEEIQENPELVNSLTEEALNLEFDLQPLGKQRCWSCARCGGGLVGVVVGWAVGVPAACVITAGAGCFWAILAGFGGAAMVATECTECDQCLHPPSPDPNPPPGGGSSGGCQQAGGCCPAETHECCNNQCCSDTNPPTSCN